MIKNKKFEIAVTLLEDKDQLQNVLFGVDPSEIVYFQDFLENWAPYICLMIKSKPQSKNKLNFRQLPLFYAVSLKTIAEMADFDPLFKEIAKKEFGLFPERELV